MSVAPPSRRTSDGRARHVARGREPGIHKHNPAKSMAWPAFMVFGRGPQGPSRNDRGFFRILPAEGGRIKPRTGAIRQRRFFAARDGRGAVRHGVGCRRGRTTLTSTLLIGTHPSPPFRAEREGPIAQRWEGEVGFAGVLATPTSPRRAGPPRAGRSGGCPLRPQGRRGFIGRCRRMCTNHHRFA